MTLIQNIEICKGYKPHEKQKAVHRSKKRFVTVVAGTRAGKTYSCAVEFVRRIFADIASGKAHPQASTTHRHSRPRLHYWVVSPNHSLLKEPIKYLLGLIPEEMWQPGEKGKKGWYEEEHALKLRGNILIEFKSADDPTKLVASGIDGLWVDEVCRMRRDAWEGQLRMRLTDHEGWALFSSTPMGFDWVWSELYNRGIEGSPNYDPDYASFKWFTADNPAIPRKEVELARRTLPDKYFKREYEADFNSFAGLIFDEFDPRLHVISDAQLRKELGLAANAKLSMASGRFKQIIAGQDFGFTSPGAIVVIAKIADNNYVILDESYASDRPILSMSHNELTWLAEAQRFKKEYGVSSFYCDPARPDARSDLIKNGIPAHPGNNDVKYGLRKMAETIHPSDGKPAIRILSKCKNLLAEIGKYCWDTNRHDEIREKPAPDQQDHALDALRYGIVELVRNDLNPNRIKPDKSYTPVF